MNLKQILAATAVAIVTSGSALANQISGAAFTVPEPDVQDIAAQNGQARIIVQLRESAGLKSIRTGTDAGDAAYTAANRALQAGVLSAIFATTAGRGLKNMDVVPMFALSATAEEIAALRDDPRVEMVWHDRPMKPSLNDAVGIIKMTGSGGGYAKGATGKGRVVAILDSGVNSANEFMTGKVIEEACYNTTDGAQGSSTRCPGNAESATGAGAGADCVSSSLTGCGHGTHVAGIAAGKNPSPGVGEPNHGVAKNASIMAINVFSRFDGLTCGAFSPCILSYPSDQILGLERVYKKRKDAGGKPIAAANMSLGGGESSTFCNDPTKPIITKLRDAGVATVIAAGNSFLIGQVSFPGCVKAAITVAATSKKTSSLTDRLAIYTNIGPQVDTLAPGGDVSLTLNIGGNDVPYTSYPFGTDEDKINSSYDAAYDQLAGTSMAAPAVAGVIAALKSRKACRGKSVAAIESALRNSGTSITDWRPDFYNLNLIEITKRRIDIKKLMKKLNCY
jgi:serine protease